MRRIEGKILRLFVGLLAIGMGAVILVSAVAILSIRNTSMIANRTIGSKSVENCEIILKKEIGIQTETYVSSCKDVIENKLLQTAQVMEVIQGKIENIYNHPERYALTSYENAGKVSGEGKQMHWLLPEDIKFEGEIREEIYRLGDLMPLFQSFLDEKPQVRRIYFTSDSGVNIGYDEDYEKKPDTFDGKNTSWYQDAKAAEKLVVSDAYIDSFLQRLIVTFSVPCYQSDGTLAGVLAVDLLMDDLVKLINEIELEFDGYAMLLSETGKVVAAPQLTKENEEDTAYFLGTKKKALLQKMEQSKHGIVESEIEGRDKYVVFSRIEMAGWNVVIVLDQNELMQTAKHGSESLWTVADEAKEQMTQQLIIACFLWAVVVVMVLLIILFQSKKTAGRISDPIEKLAAELDVATQIQASMLPCIFPPFPEREDIDIYASMTPAKEVGGDFYDFFLIDEDHLCMIMADVSGKGVPAALFMVVAKTLLKDNVQSGKSIEKVFYRVNNQLCENNEAGMFVTVFLAVLELSTGRLTYVNAGHNPPLIKRKKGATEWVDQPAGFVLAGMEGMEYEQGEVHLAPGDLFFAYTDGVTEAVNEQLKLYGNEQLFSAIDEAENVIAKYIIQSVDQQVRKFMGRAEQADDITMLALRYGKAEAKYFMSVAAEAKELPSVEQFLKNSISKEDFPEDTFRQILLAAEEIFVNIANYAYPNGEGVVEIEYTMQTARITLVFIDSGIPFNPLEKEEPDLTLGVQERDIGGLGIHLVKQCMDQTSYEYKDGKNRFTMVKIL